MTTTTEIDFEVAGQKAEMAFGFLGGAVVAGMIYLGDKLGLYRAMAGAGPLTSDGLAAKTGLSERWLREWLMNQGAAGVLEYRGDGKFELSPEGALVFVDEANPFSAIGGFAGFPEQFAVLNDLPQAFKTGIGFTYDHGGNGVAVGVERMLGPWNRTSLVSEAMPALGLVEKLQQGATVADVGCGAAVGTVALAQAFPNSQFHGYDNSVHAIARAQANVREAGVTNVTIHNVDSDPMPAEPTFDLVTFLDVLHDMARPDLVLAAVHKAMKPGGTLFVVDVNCAPDYETNAANPLGPMLYGFSIMLCMSSSASQPDGLALGTVGLPQPKMAEMVTAAGFKDFRPVPGLEHPFNAYYEAKG